MIDIHNYYGLVASSVAFVGSIVGLIFDGKEGSKAAFWSILLLVSWVSILALMTR